MGQLFSPGKLLLTSEYTVLDGALALAVPTKWGQEFFFESNDDAKSEVVWEAYHQDQLWLYAKINYQTWEIAATNLPQAAAFVLKVLQNVQKLSDIKFRSDSSYHLKTNLQFPADYGLGSSSTLMNNLAGWAGIDAFELNELSLGGSGYDVAVAKAKSAILYQKTDGERLIKAVDFNPVFKNELIFIHLNQKQDSREGIEMYRAKPKSPELIEAFSWITEEVMTCENLEYFSQLMEVHERKLSAFLGIQTIKEKYFENCPAFVKSLGAWGGDFVMSAKFPGFKDYFSGKGFEAVFSWDEIIG
ncbi:30S ribosomal protein S6 [Chryseobacterium manosquense]|uniref:30S ribosomal protein S6 n=1 Tax=Chryseobacterium manosquense TaxID=2754694 RepID=A0A7H1DUE7_9FLAO|nr:GYDIA family GHMP kinase [Chryseobacterium manosquense]QNS40605.1 30S ribosomal protein S6 [Chryseobacterium manosquense]